MADDGPSFTEAQKEYLEGFLRGVAARQGVGSAVELTVGIVRYELRGRRRSGVASGYLADRVSAGETVAVFVRKAQDFRLPADDDAPVVMIGTGTGIAPFRASTDRSSARFAFPAIVDRSPVVVAISSNGTAPALERCCVPSSTGCCRAGWAISRRWRDGSGRW